MDPFPVFEGTNDGRELTVSKYECGGVPRDVRCVRSANGDADVFNSRSADGPAWCAVRRTSAKARTLYPWVARRSAIDRKC